jgi:hypothetical protein
MFTSRFMAAIVSALLVGAAYAQTSTDKTPLTQGISSVGRNLERDPDNKGLQNASKRLKANQDRLETRRDDRRERADRVERPGHTERPERAGRPDRTERSGR